MGCSPGDKECFDREKPAHRVTLTRGFWMGQTEVTVEAYRRYASATGTGMPPVHVADSVRADGNSPVVYVSWNDSQGYCKWAGARLPTEAEWEYAARGGSTDVRYGPLSEVAWYTGNSGGQRHDAAQMRANGFGLYDTLGNVWEWVNDWFDANYYQDGPSEDPPGPGAGKYRVLRGGSWFNPERYIRASVRIRGLPDVRVHNDAGFRCAGEADDR